MCAELRDLARESLSLLEAAVQAKDRFPALFNLDIYGSIIGMFELNNLGETVFLVVAVLAAAT